MNKFIPILLLACSGLLLSVSATPLELSGDELESSALNPSNDEETAELDESTKIFSDFCTSTRDYVIGDIKSRTAGYAASIFNVLFSSVENIGLNAVEVTRDATDKLANQLKDPDASIAEPTNEIESIIAEGQKSIASEQTAPTTLLTGFYSVLSATKNAVTSSVMNKLADIKSKFGMNLLTGSVKDACDRVAAYEDDIIERFDQFKASLKDAGANVGPITVGEVPCVTSRRVIRLDGICKFALAGTSPMIKAIAYKPMNTRKTA